MQRNGHGRALWRLRLAALQRLAQIEVNSLAGRCGRGSVPLQRTGLETRMTLTTLLRRGALAALTLAGSAALAQSNLGFLRDTPLSRFNEEDLRLLREAGEGVLRSDEPTATRAWRNDKTRHSGSVTLVRRFAFESRDCRRLRVDSRAGGMQGTTHLSVCRSGSDGPWAIDTRARPPVAR